MKNIFKQMRVGFMFVLACLFGFSPMNAMRPDENELSTHLRGDGKADGPVSYPGGLLTGLSGMKDDPPSAAAVKAASKELYEKIQTVQSELKDELNTIVGSRIDSLQKEKIDKIHTAMDEIRSGLKDNNKKLEDIEKLYAQKLAALQTVPQSVMGVKDLQEHVKVLQGGLMSNWMRTNQIESGVKDEINKTYDRLIQSGMRNLEGRKATQFLIANNTFLMPAELDNEIQQLVSIESGILNRVNVVTTSIKDYRKIINRRGTGLGDAAESDTRVATNAPTMSEVALYYGDLYAYYEVAVHALDDAGYDIETEFKQSTTIDMAESLDTDIITGSGVKTAKGLNAYPYVDSLTWGSIKRLQSAGVVDFEFLLDIIYGLRKGYRRNASFLVGNLGLREFRGIKDPNDAYVFWPSFNEGRYAESILGYPIDESEDLEGPLVDGARLCYFADFRRAYIVHMLRGLRLVRDEITNPGFVKFYLSRRWGGGLADSNAIVMGQKTGSAS
jgi:HK97 family phage major capsid protein